jgi:biotin carboxylase
VSDLVVVGVPWNSDELETAARAARDLGLRLVVADTAGNLARLAPSAAFGQLAVPAMTPAALAAAIAASGARWVVSITTMRLELAARVREALGMPGNPGAVEATVGDKLLTRARLAQAGLTRVRHWGVARAQVAAVVRDLPLPVVIKPRTLAGSNGVRLLRAPGDLADALRSYAADAGDVLIEQYLAGAEVSVEGLVTDGALTVFAVTDKVNTGPPYFQETGHVMPSRLAAARLGEIGRYLQDVVTALGIVTAPVHAEVKLLGDRVELVEVHTRYGGGNIVALLAHSAGVDAFGAYFAAVTGAAPPPTRAEPEQTWGVGFFTARVGRELRWRSFGLPHPGAVVAIDLDRRRAPKLEEFRGVRVRYWRAGHALFCSRSYQEVYENVTAMAAAMSDD